MLTHPSIHLKSFTGPDMAGFIPDLASLRIRVFREFPYLYEGTTDYEKEYLHTYIQAPNAIIVVAFDGKKVIGASTGMPLVHETDNVKQPWTERGYDVSNIFYYGESVLLPAYRGMGIGVGFFHQRESWARSLKQFNTLTFCAVVRPDDHPMKPKDYKPLDAFWQKRGFSKTKELTCQMHWQDIDQREETMKSLQFWRKQMKE